MRIPNIALIVLAIASLICANTFGADPQPASKKTLTNFYSEEVSKIQQKAYDKVSKESKDPEFVRKELLEIYSNLEFQRQTIIQKTIYSFVNEIPQNPVSKEEIAESRYIVEMKIKVLGILATLPPPKTKTDR
jgi:hypothetical protein